MVESDDEDYVFYGTPLEPLEEEEIPRKKPIQIQDQIATDKQGRRRFHGAFTGGFSAGFYNTVATPEGWTPAVFKSSREKKAELHKQKPEDFMDDEDTDEFGIAPSVLRAKPEYSGSSRVKKRERVTFSDGPIPGEPVLQSILQPPKETIGVLLLMKMGWKPGQGIGPRLTNLEKKRQKKKNQGKVYGCFMPTQGKESDDESDSDIDMNQLFAPDDVESIFVKPKTNRFGMGYSGLDKTSLLSSSLNIFEKQDTLRILDKNRKLAIRGQAFGVGTFEDEDADIYAKDDMSQYDFALETSGSLKEKKRQEREAKKLLALTSGDEDVIEGFLPAKKPPEKKKYFPPPQLPPGYDGIHVMRKSRFGPEHNGLPEIKGKHMLTAVDRVLILDENEKKNLAQLDAELPKLDENVDIGFRPFLSDPVKQARYERYLQFVKIGAKDAFSTIQPKQMSEWEKERERNEFEQASRLYKPLSGTMADRFANAELPDESLDPLAPVKKFVGGVNPILAEAAKSRKFGKLTRSIFEWAPVSILCKRMNIAEPTTSGDISLCDVAKEANSKTKPKFSVFDFLNASKSVDSQTISNKSEVEAVKKVEEEKSDINRGGEKPEEESKPEEASKRKLTLPSPTAINFDEPLEKVDLFKAIFCSSDEEEEDEEQAENDAALEENDKLKSNDITSVNSLRNTSPPRGIFANLDLDALKVKPPPKPESPPKEKTKSDEPANDKQDPSPGDGPDPQMFYGPILPKKPVFMKPAVKMDSTDSSSSSGNEWVEKEKEKKKSKHFKKHKKEKKKSKKKSKKKKKH